MRISEFDDFEEEEEEQILKSGYMKVMEKSMLKKSKSRFFTLTKYDLMEYKDEFKNEIIAAYEVDDLHNVRKKEETVCFKHQLDGKDKKLKLKAPTKSEADAWTDAIIKATQHDIMAERMSDNGKLQQLLMGQRKDSSSFNSPAYCITHHKPRPASYWVCLRVQAGRDLMPMDSNGKSDPYVVVRYWDETHEKEKGIVVAKTKIMKKTLSPDWDTELGFFCAGPNLTIECWDWDLASEDDPMGEVAIDLRTDKQEVKPGLTWVQLQKPEKQLRRGGRKANKHKAARKNSNTEPGKYGQLKLALQIHSLKSSVAVAVDPSSIESGEVSPCPLLPHHYCPTIVTPPLLPPPCPSLPRCCLPLFPARSSLSPCAIGTLRISRTCVCCATSPMPSSTKTITVVGTTPTRT
jgi:hypothetical protein